MISKTLVSVKVLLCLKKLLFAETRALVQLHRPELFVHALVFVVVVGAARVRLISKIKQMIQISLGGAFLFAIGSQIVAHTRDRMIL